MPLGTAVIQGEGEEGEEEEREGGGHLPGALLHPLRHPGGGRAVPPGGDGGERG